MKKVTIIGSGRVGSHVASSLLTQDVCNEIAIIDIDEQKALAHATDLGDMLSYLTTDALVYLGDYSDLDNSDIVVICTSGLYAVEDRLVELEDTRRTIDEILPNILASKFNGIIVSISNPCDLIAQYIKSKTHYNVVGTGTMLDSSRLKVRLANALGVSPKSVNGYMLGEHGNSQFAAFSLTSINGIALKDYIKLNDVDINLKQIQKSVVEAGYFIVCGKGFTEFGIGAACANLVKAILDDERKVLPCSTYVEEQGVYASVPCLIGREGVVERIKIKLPANEQKAFEHSCDVLRTNLKRFI